MTDILNTGDRIKQTAQAMFMQYGLRSVSMDDIANSLGISKKTIYQFYADKDALVNAVIAEKIIQNQCFCQDQRVHATNAIQEVFIEMDFVTAMIRSMNPSLIFDMQKYHPQAYKHFSDHKNNYLYGTFKENILRGISEELYKADLDVELIARFRVETMMVVLSPEFHQKVNKNIADIEESLTMHYLFGLVSLKGYKLAIKYQEQRSKTTNKRTVK